MPAAILVTLSLVLGPTVPSAADHDGAFAGQATGLSCDDDASPTFCTGFLPGLGDVALDVDLALPATGPYPLLVVVHGWGGSKGSGSASASYPGDDALTDRGYAVLRYSARGFGDSWGQTHLASLDVEIEDLKLLVSSVVDDERFQVVPTRIGVTGASYGGGHSYLIATENRWTTAEGTGVRVAAVAPIVPWTDLIESLMPNGIEPIDAPVVGTSKLSYVSGLFVGGLRDDPERPYPNYIELLPELYARVMAGEPYQVGDRIDPVLEQGIRELGELRSVAWQDEWLDTLRRDRKARVPILQIQGWTDDLFPVTE
ncbi:MAG: alpha/beta hydrolase, partial [Actinobacteria bacterium]|nr:alpha/beta hydrolase [Actinomycetota bacterium]